MNRSKARVGMSAIVLMLVGVLGGISAIGVLAAVSIPAYQDYVMRAKTTEAYEASHALTELLILAYIDNGTLPKSLAGITEVEAMPRFVRSVDIDPNTGVISMHVQLSDRVSGTMKLVPEIDDVKNVFLWHCETDLRTRYVPRACRGE